jgi:hypothetical protein
MEYRYHIYHDFEAAKQIPFGNSFGERQAQHEYSCMSGSLAVLYQVSGVEASCEELQDGRGVIITFRSELTEDEIETTLSHFLTTLNGKVERLCLVAGPPV